MDMVGALDVHREQVPSIGWTGRTVGVRMQPAGRLGRVGFRRWLAQFDGEQSSWRSKPSDRSTTRPVSTTWPRPTSTATPP